MVTLALLVVWAFVVATILGTLWGTRRGRAFLRAIAGLLGWADDLLALLSLAAVLAVMLVVAGLKVLALFGPGGG